MNFKKNIILFLFVVIVFLLVCSVFKEPNGFMRIEKIKTDIATQKIINQELDKANKKITDKITRLEKNDKKYMENIVRQEGDMIKKDKETIVIFKN